MADTNYEHELEAAIVDLTDGSLRRGYDIYEHTGLSEERCQELEELINTVFERYTARNS